VKCRCSRESTGCIRSQRRDEKRRGERGEGDLLMGRQEKAMEEEECQTRNVQDLSFRKQKHGLTKMQDAASASRADCCIDSASTVHHLNRALAGIGRHRQA
jgi:hypothetical protein